jgi:hypothetical protein
MRVMPNLGGNLLGDSQNLCGLPIDSLQQRRESPIGANNVPVPVPTENSISARKGRVREPQRAND